MLTLLVVPIVTIIIGFVLASIKGWLQGPEEYRIYFIGPLRDDPIVYQVYEGLNERKLPEIDSIPVKIETEDDRGDLDEVDSLARDIAQRRDVLMVVGHGYSSTSKKALPEYLAQQPKIPVMLVRETNPDLLPSLCKESELPRPVLRLSPTDEDQAETAVRFASQNDATSFLVVKDSENPVYSTYLANQIVREIHERKKSVMLSTTDAVIHLRPEVLEALKVDCILFVGEYHKALMLIRWTTRIYEQNKNSSQKRPMIILSDWSADPKLPEIGGDDVEGVFLTHPRSAAEVGDAEIGYRGYGRDTAWILEKLLIKTNEILSKRTDLFITLKNWLGIHRVSDARQVLAQAMIQLPGLKGSPSGEEYVFDRKGHLSGGQFHVWVVKDGKYEEVP